jgi:hypothetical protein
MSQPLRFKPVNPAHEMIYSTDGGWVSWEDYARLKAEVERLTKAGDAMVPLLGRGDWHIARNDWNAAKEGKQSK